MSQRKKISDTLTGVDYQAKKKELAKELFFLKEYGEKSKDEQPPRSEAVYAEKGEFEQEWD